jgi:hypothetical protein
MLASDLMMSMCSHSDSAWVQMMPPGRSARCIASKNGCRAAAAAAAAAAEQDAVQLHCLRALGLDGTSSIAEHQDMSIACCVDIAVGWVN